MEKNIEEASSPIATTEEIQKRLVRPLSLQYSQSSTSMLTYRDDRTTRNSAQFDADVIEFQRKREATNRRLEDYLDPVLLSAICAKVGGKRKNDGEVKLKEFEREYWPIDQSKSLMEVSRSEKRVKFSNEDVDIGKDLDLIGDVRDEGEYHEELCCTPFRCFERTVLKQFNSGGEG